MNKSKPPINNDDKEIFHQAMRDVTPLKHKTIHPKKPQRLISAKQKWVDETTEDDDFRYIPPHQFLRFTAQDILSYRHVSLPERTWQQLKKGKFPIQASLDLHGKTRQESEKELVHFLQECRQRGLRSVCVIHGKGQYSINQIPTLKNLCYHLLRQHPHILAFHSANKKDGE